jgi:hypothetical protein
VKSPSQNQPQRPLAIVTLPDTKRHMTINQMNSPTFGVRRKYAESELVIGHRAEDKDRI